MHAVSFVAVFFLFLNSEDRLGVPDAAAIESARTKIREVLHSEFKEARNSVAKIRLAETLVGRGNDPAESPHNRYAFFIEAETLCVDVADLLAAFRTIDAMSAVFDQSPFQRKIDLVQRFRLIAKNASQHRALAAVSLKLSKDAIAAEEYAVARECCQTAVNCSKAASDGALLSRAVTSLRQTELLFDCRQAAQVAELVLLDQPDDIDANRQLAKYTCFVRRDWAKGVSLLSRAPVAELVVISQFESFNPVKTETQLELAKLWLGYAEQQKSDLERRGAASRAAFWFDKVAASLRGLEQIAALKMLNTANEVACEVDFRKLLNRKANGLEVDSKVDCESQMYPLELKPTFDLGKSWLLSLEFSATNLDVGYHQVFFWGDGRAGCDPLFVRLTGSDLSAVCSDCARNRLHPLTTTLPLTALGRWINLKFTHDAVIGELNLYVDFRHVGRESTYFTPNIDRLMPLYLGGTPGSEQRFVGQVRHLWLGNVP